MLITLYKVYVHGGIDNSAAINQRSCHNALMILEDVD